jgi:hypothetical protein
MAEELRCKKHPKYKGLRRPRVDCADCRTLYGLKRWKEGPVYSALNQSDKAIAIGTIDKEL